MSRLTLLSCTSKCREGAAAKHSVSVVELLQLFLTRVQEHREERNKASMRAARASARDDMDTFQCRVMIFSPSRLSVTTEDLSFTNDLSTIGMLRERVAKLVTTDTAVKARILSVSSDMTFPVSADRVRISLPTLGRLKARRYDSS